MAADLIYITWALASLALVAYNWGAWRSAPPERKPAVLPILTSGVGVAAAFLVAAPSIGTGINRLTGVNSLSVMLMSVFSSAWVCSAQAMLLYWRFPPARAWRATRWIVLLYGAVVVTELVLFLLGDRPQDRHLDFLGVYADTPYLGEMTVLHFAAYTAGMVSLAWLCWRWSTDAGTSDQPWLRRGLRCTALGIAFSVLSGTLSVTAVVASWFGADLRYLGAVVAPLAVVISAPFVIVGMSVPTWGPKLPGLRAWARARTADLRDYRRLRPLWRALSEVDPDMVHPRRLSGWLRAPGQTYWVLIEINDWLHNLRAYRAPAVEQRLRHHLATVAPDAGQPWAVLEAAEIKAALHAFANGVKGRAQTTDDRTTPEPASRLFASERGRLFHLATAFTHPEIDHLVAAASCTGQTDNRRTR